MYVVCEGHGMVSNRFIKLQVLDPRTRMVLFKMLNRGVFSDINGCLSTGKEVSSQYLRNVAGWKFLNSNCCSRVCDTGGSGCLYWVQANVYHATTEAGDELAVKVYKTSILVFKYE